MTKTNQLKATPPGAWKKNVTDADILSEIVYQASKFDHVFKWDPGHPERRKPQENWSYSEWGNHLADGLAAEAWNQEDAYESSSQFAPQLPHAATLALHLPDGSLHGNIKRVLPPIITAANGRQQLARYIHYTEEQLAAVDWETLQQSSKCFTTTAMARFHFCKSFNNQWYTDAQAHKYNNDLSSKCRCCNLSDESIAHIFACQSREPTHVKFRKSFTAVLQKQKIEGGLLNALELGVKLVLSNEDTHRGDIQWQGACDGPEVYIAIHQFYNDNTVEDAVKFAFSHQTYLGWEDAFQGRFALAWKDLHTEKAWRKPVLEELMKWGRECWSSRCSKLFGPKKDRYRLRRHRLHLQVKLWYEAPYLETMVRRTSLPDQDSILRKHNDGIVRWLDQQHSFRDSILTRTRCQTGQLSMLSFVRSPEDRQQHNESFQTRLQETRRAELPIEPESSGPSDGDRPPEGNPPAEEPPD